MMPAYEKDLQNGDTLYAFIETELLITSVADGWEPIGPPRWWQEPVRWITWRRTGLAYWIAPWLKEPYD